MKQNKMVKRNIISLIALLLIIAIFKAAVETVYVPSSSMEPEIQKGSIIWAARQSIISNRTAEPKRGEVITFFNKGEGKNLIKRIIGLPGETISFQNGDIYINGVILIDPYCKEPHTTFSDIAYTVPSGCVFCLGDNREHSRDSRAFDDPYIKINEIDSKYLASVKIPELLQPVFSKMAK